MKRTAKNIISGASTVVDIAPTKRGQKSYKRSGKSGSIEIDTYSPRKGGWSIAHDPHPPAKGIERDWVKVGSTIRGAMGSLPIKSNAKRKK